METMDEQIDAVREALTASKEFGVEVEVILFALTAMKENPNLTISRSLGIALQEWDL